MPCPFGIQGCHGPGSGGYQCRNCTNSYNSPSEAHQETQPQNAAPAAAAAAAAGSPSSAGRRPSKCPLSQDRRPPNVSANYITARINTPSAKNIKKLVDEADDTYNRVLETAYKRYINFNPSFSGILDIIQNRAEGTSNQKQMESCYKWQIDNPTFGKKGLYRNPQMYKTCDYLTGIHFGHAEGPQIEGQKTAKLFDNSLVWRKTNIQLDAEHLASMNGMIACFGLPSPNFFRNGNNNRKKLIALCAMAGSMKITNSVKSNQLLQTITINEVEVNKAFENCKSLLLKSVPNNSKRGLLLRLDEKKKAEKWAFKPNADMIDWLINSFYTGTDTAKGTSIRFIDFPNSICMSEDGFPHEQFVRYFVHKYCGGEDVKEKYDNFKVKTKELMTCQAEHLCDILNMYVTVPELITRCVNIQTGKGNLLDPGGNFFRDFDTFGELIVECINFPIKADAIYEETAQKSMEFGARAAANHKASLKAAARARRSARAEGAVAVVAGAAGAAGEVAELERKAQSFFSFFSKKYNSILSKIRGKGSIELKFKIHSGYFILKRKEWLAANGAANGAAANATANGAANATANGAAANGAANATANGAAANGAANGAAANAAAANAAEKVFDDEDYSEVKSFINCKDENDNLLLAIDAEISNKDAENREREDTERSQAVEAEVEEELKVEVEEELKIEKEKENTRLTGVQRATGLLRLPQKGKMLTQTEKNRMNMPLNKRRNLSNLKEEMSISNLCNATNLKQELKILFPISLENYSIFRERAWNEIKDLCSIKGYRFTNIPKNLYDSRTRKRNHRNRKTRKV
jgi:hypothetical protein